MSKRPHVVYSSLLGWVLLLFLWSQNFRGQVTKPQNIYTFKAATMRDLLPLNEFPLPRETREPVVFFVLSRRGSFNVRNTIRTTWGVSKENIYFVVGSPCIVPSQYRDKDEGGNVACKVAPVQIKDGQYFEDVQRQILHSTLENEMLLEEQASFQDILLVDEVDVYRSLPKKLKFIYAYVVQQLPGAKWIVKIDDDFFVRVQEFSNFVLSKFNESSPTVVSGLISEGKAATVGKWKEVPQYPTGKKYPPFPLGSFGHAVSRPIVEYIAKHRDYLFDYQGEDTSLGIWLSQLDAPRVKFEETGKMENNGRCIDRRVFIIGHDITPQKMVQCNNSFSVNRNM